jgi:hypothetical protein
MDLGLDLYGLEQGPTAGSCEHGSELKIVESNLITGSNNFELFCGLVVTFPGYRSRGPGFDSQRYQISWVVGLEQGLLSLVRIIEELLERKVADSV